MVFITGSRQVGKPCLAKEVMKEFNVPQYLNYDNIDDRKIIIRRSWRFDAGLSV